MKLREMRLRNYLQHTEKRNQVRHSWRLRGLGGWAILRREGKGTRVLLQKAAVGKDVLTCFHLAMATWTLGALCREKALSELPNGSMIKNGSSHPSTQGD